MSSDLFSEHILIFLLVICSLSIIGACWVTIDITLIHPNKNNDNKIVNGFIKWIAITDGLDAVTEIIGLIYFLDHHDASSNNQLCHLQAFGTQLFSVSSILYITAVAFIRFYYYVCQRNVNKTNKIISSKFKIMHIIIWIITFVLTIIPVITQSYGPAGIHCWIVYSDWVLRIALFYGLLWMCIIVICVMYCCVHYFVKDQFDKSIHQLKAYPVATMICWIPLTTVRALEYFGYNWIWLNIISYTCLLSIGFIDALIYIWYNKERYCRKQDESIGNPSHTTKTSTPIQMGNEQTTTDSLHSHLESDQIGEQGDIELNVLHNDRTATNTSSSKDGYVMVINKQNVNVESI